MAVIEHGVPHLETIRAALVLLFKARSDNRLPKPTPLPRWARATLHDPGDPVLSTQRTAKAIADTYSLKVGLINVSFRSDMTAAGTIELGRSNDFFIEVNAEFKTDPRRVVAILAHEVAHIVLHRAGLSLGDDFADEIMTDCTSIMYGFGVQALDAYEVQQGAVGVERVERKLGYLTPEEMGLVIAMTSEPGDRPSFRSREASWAYKEGRRYLSEHCGWPPLTWAPIGKALLYRAQRTWALRSETVRRLRPGKRYGFEKRGQLFVVFQCPLCAQALRLRASGHRTSVRCGSCKFQFNAVP